MIGIGSASYGLTSSDQTFRQCRCQTIGCRSTGGVRLLTAAIAGSVDTFS